MDDVVVAGRGNGLAVATAGAADEVFVDVSLF